MKTKSFFPDLETYAPRIVALSLLALLFLALAGCKAATPVDAGPDVIGVYTLVSADSKSVPCSLDHEGATELLKSGSFTINADGTCLSQTTFSVPPNKEIHREVKATYTQNGAELTMRWQGAGTTKGQLHGTEFTMNNEGMLFAYRK
jgi:hypothetical protein